MDEPLPVLKTLSTLEVELDQWRLRFIGFLQLYESTKDEIGEPDKHHARRIWSKIVQFSLISGISEDEMQVETGASLNTLHRWLTGDALPRHLTRALLAGSFAAVLKEKNTPEETQLAPDNDP